MFLCERFPLRRVKTGRRPNLNNAETTERAETPSKWASILALACLRAGLAGCLGPATRGAGTKSETAARFVQDAWEIQLGKEHNKDARAEWAQTKIRPEAPMGRGMAWKVDHIRPISTASHVIVVLHLPLFFPSRPSRLPAGPAIPPCASKLLRKFLMTP